MLILEKSDGLTVFLIPHFPGIAVFGIWVVVIATVVCFASIIFDLLDLIFVEIVMLAALLVFHVIPRFPILH